MVGLTGQALTIGGFEAALLAYVLAAAAMVALIFTLALLLTRAQDRTVSAMRDGAPAVKRWGGRILVLVGAWFLALAIFAEPLADVFPV